MFSLRSAHNRVLQGSERTKLYFLLLILRLYPLILDGVAILGLEVSEGLDSALLTMESLLGVERMGMRRIDDNMTFLGVYLGCSGVI